MIKNFSDAALVFMFTKCYSMNNTYNIYKDFLRTGKGGAFVEPGV